MNIETKTEDLEIYIDGAASGNPGPAGIGVVVLRDNYPVKNISEPIGQATNNTAEYTALIWGLQEALIQKAEKIKVNTDSLLLANHLNRKYRIREPHLKVLYNQVIHLLSGFKEIEINYIRRDENKGADKLAKRAIEEQTKMTTPKILSERKVRAPEGSVVGNTHPLFLNRED